MNSYKKNTTYLYSIVANWLTTFCLCAHTKNRSCGLSLLRDMMNQPYYHQSDLFSLKNSRSSRQTENGWVLKIFGTIQQQNIGSVHLAFLAVIICIGFVTSTFASVSCPTSQPIRSTWFLVNILTEPRHSSVNLFGSWMFVWLILRSMYDKTGHIHL